jgi:hypothetical protein
MGLRYSADPERSDVVLPDQSGTAGVTMLRVRADKTQRAGQVTERWVLDGVAPAGFCMSVFLRRYAEKVGFVEGQPIFLMPKLGTPGRKERLQCEEAYIRFLARAIAERAGDDTSEVSTHSFRRGGASWYFGQTGSVEQVQEIGFWKSTAVLGYAASRKQRVITYLQQILARQRGEGAEGRNRLAIE